MNSQYPGTCKKCGKTWTPGMNIFYQKEPKAICIDETCFNSQKGTQTKIDAKPEITPTSVMGELEVLFQWTASKQLSNEALESFCKVYISRMMSARK